MDRDQGLPRLHPLSHRLVDLEAHRRVDALVDPGAPRTQLHRRQPHLAGGEPRQPSGMGRIELAAYRRARQAAGLLPQQYSLDV